MEIDIRTLLARLNPECKRAMGVADYVSGRPFASGTLLG